MSKSAGKLPTLEVPPDLTVPEADQRYTIPGANGSLEVTLGADATFLLTARGTPLFMAPEVLAGRPCTPASDVYGLGAASAP